MSVPDPAATDWVPVWNIDDATTSPPIPKPVVNGQWLKGTGGAVVWSAITPQDIAGYPADASKALMGDASWQNVLTQLGGSGLKTQLVPSGTYAFPANDGSGNSQVDVPLPIAWPTAHVAFLLGYIWPLGHWGFRLKLFAATGQNRATIMMDQYGGAQSMSISGLSFGY